MLTGAVNENVTAYPEMVSTTCSFSFHFSCESVQSDLWGRQRASSEICFQKSVGNSTRLKTLVRLLLVSPASSAEAERSFSALRRLKTWLRSTMGWQWHKPGLMLWQCHVHQNLLDSVDVKKLTDILCPDTNAYIWKWITSCFSITSTMTEFSRPKEVRSTMVTVNASFVNVASVLFGISANQFKL